MTAAAQLASAVHTAEARAAGGDPSSAATGLAEALDSARSRLGHDHLDVLAAAHRLSGLYRQDGALLEARRVLATALEAGRRIHGEDHPLLLSMTYELAVVAHELGLTEEAARNLEILGELGPDVLGTDHAYVAAAARGYPTVALPVLAASTVDGTTVDERRRRIVAAAAVSGVAALALVAVVSAVVLVKSEPERASRTSAKPAAGPSGGPSTSPSPEPVPSPVSSNGVAVADSPASPPPVPRTSVPAPSGTTAPVAIGGRYRIRPAHTGMCVGEGPERGSGRTVLGQYPCASASPGLSVEAAGQNSYRILLERGANRTACVTVDFGGIAPGLPFAGRECADGRQDQRFTFEPVASPAGGYRVRSVSGARFCVGVQGGGAQGGVPLAQSECAERPHLVFTLERR